MLLVTSTPIIAFQTFDAQGTLFSPPLLKVLLPLLGVFSPLHLEIVVDAVVVTLVTVYLLVPFGE